MPEREQHTWRFHCGVCAKELTDATALFTLCGHFFCADSSYCTRLNPGNGAGRCEQCGIACDADTLANRGERFDDRVRSFVFNDLKKDLMTIAEIFDFRDKHLTILRENAASQASRIQNLKAEYSAQLREMNELSVENDALRSKVALLEARAVPSAIEPSSQRLKLPRVPSVEIVDGSSTRMDPTRAENSPRDTLQYSGKSRTKMKPRPSPDCYEKWESRARAAASIAQPRVAHGSKRRWEGRSEPSAVNLNRSHLTEPSVAAANRSHRMDPLVETGNRSHRIGTSVVAGNRSHLIERSVAASRAQRNAPCFTSSRATAVTELSRFARDAAPTAIGCRAQRSAPRFISSRATAITELSRFARDAATTATVTRIPGSTRREVGDWQSKVSILPRPSATPNFLAQKPSKRSRHGDNPMARR